MLRFLLSILLAGGVPAQGALAEETEHSWSQPFGIEVADGWVQEEAGELSSFYHPNGNGVLKIQSISAPNVVDKDRLRNMTNVDRSTPLTWQDWGDFSGYQYDYSERGSFFRQWWLVDQRTIIFVVYESSVEIEGADIDEVNRIVNSMTANDT
jgi:hypothetical protein